MADESDTHQHGTIETFLRRYQAGPYHIRQSTDDEASNLQDEPSRSNLHTPNRPLSPVSEVDEERNSSVAASGGLAGPAYERVSGGEETPRKIPRISLAEADIDRKPTRRREAWQPFFLRRRVLIAFLTVFLMLVAALETIHVLSDHNNGLATSTSNMRYSWTYGPTAIFTLLLALWGRVDYQARLTRPWYRASEVGNLDGTKGQTLLMDYVSMFSLVVPFRAIARRDWLVAATSAVSLIFTILNILSTGLIVLTSVSIQSDSVATTVTSRFLNDPSGLERAGSLPYFSMAGINNYSLAFPEGTSEQFTYQPVAADFTAISELKATVEGLAVGLDCQPASVSSVNTSSDGSVSQVDVATSINFTVPGCELSSEYTTKLAVSGSNGPSYVFSFFPGTCQPSTKSANDTRLGLLVAQLNYTTYKESDSSSAYQASGVVLRSAQMICSPNYNISDVDLIKNSTGIVGLSPGRNSAARTLSNISAVDIMRSTFSAAHDAGLLSFLYLLGLPFSTDPAATGLFTTQQALFPDNSSLFDSAILEQAVQRYYAQISTFVVQRNLMETASTPGTGSATTRVERLLVQNLACQLMVGLCSFCAVMTVCVLVSRPRNTSLACNPATIFGVAGLAAKSTLSAFPRHLGSADQKHLQESLQRSGLDLQVVGRPRSLVILNRAALRKAARDDDDDNNDNSIFPTQPPQSPAAPPAAVPKKPKPAPSLSLRSPMRLAVFLLMAGIIVALELLLSKSSNNQGLGDANARSTYQHFLWTLLPAAILSGIALYLAAVDFEIRALVPWLDIARRPSPFDHSLGLDLLSQIMPHVLLKELRTKNFAAFLTTLAALVAAVFTLVSSSLFFVSTIPQTSTGQLRMTGTFSTTNVGLPLSLAAVGELSTISSLILQSNLSYPQFTYNDLVFPTLDFDHASTALSAVNTSGLVIQTTVPAVRSGLSCRLHPPSEISVQFEFNLTDLIFGTTNYFNINVTGERCTNYSPSASFNITPTPDTGVFAAAYNGGTKISVGACSDLFYVWGNFSASSPTATATDNNINNGDGVSVSVSALSCNETLEAVDVSVAFVGGTADLVIDQTRPPVALAGTARTLDGLTAALVQPQGSVPFGLYASLATAAAPERLYADSFFDMLVTSRFALAVADLADRSDAGLARVVAAVKAQHGLIRAQSVAAVARSPMNASDTGIVDLTSSSSLSLLSSSADGEGNNTLYAAAVTAPVARQRVVQDRTATRVMEAVLGAALATGLAGWALRPRPGVLARPATSVGSVLALVAGGNVVQVMDGIAKVAREGGGRAEAGGGSEDDGRRSGVVSRGDDVVQVGGEATTHRNSRGRGEERGEGGDLDGDLDKTARDLAHIKSVLREAGLVRLGWAPAAKKDPDREEEKHYGIWVSNRAS